MKVGILKYNESKLLKKKTALDKFLDSLFWIAYSILLNKSILDYIEQSGVDWDSGRNGTVDFFFITYNSKHFIDHTSDEAMVPQSTSENISCSACACNCIKKILHQESKINVRQTTFMNSVYQWLVYAYIK